MGPIDWNSLVRKYGLKVAAMAATALVTLLGAAAGGGYLVGKDVAQAQLDTCKTALAADLPELTKKLSTVAGDLRGSFDVFGQNKTLVAQNVGLQQRLGEAAAALAKEETDLKRAQADAQTAITGLQNDLKASAEREKQLSDQIILLRGSNRQFKVASNTSEYLVDGHRVGVSAHVDNWTLAIALDNQRYDMAAGNRIPVEAKNKNCVLTLVSMNIYENSGQFDLTCIDPNVRSSSR
jgi:hypothetical protein